jgi:rhamnosyltransferase
MNSTCSITVTFHPCLQDLERQLLALIDQVGLAVIVDNGSANYTELERLVLRMGETDPGSVLLISLGSNEGVGTAQNHGLRHATNNGFAYAILLDQDSEPFPEMVKALVQCCETSGCIAAAPLIIDRRTGRVGPVLKPAAGNWRPFVRWRPGEEEGNPTHEALFLIASGTLVDLRQLPKVGNMREDYFIDHVDTEWCVRARRAGFSLKVVPTARLSHQLGDRVFRVWFFGWREIALHQPLRDYFMARNTLLMLRDSPVPAALAIYLVTRLIVLSGFFLAFAPMRIVRARQIARGIAHGIANIRGATGAFA